VLLANLGFSQTSKTIHNQQGVTVSYTLSKIGNDVNLATGTNFSKYKLHLTVQNSSSKFWEYNAINSISSKNVKGGILKLDDETFCWNGGRSTIDHFCIEDNCNNFPRYNNIAAPHQVICPNGTQECEKTFLYPTDLAGEPEIEWTSWGFVEMLNNDGSSKQNTIATKSKTDLTKKTATVPLPLYQLFGYKGFNNIREMRVALTKFIEENTVVPKIEGYAGDQFVINFRVDENGKIIEPIAYGKYPQLNEAAIKALKLSEKDWTVAIDNGKKSSTGMGTSVSFAVACGHH
jgi:hypothetical protein